MEAEQDRLTRMYAELSDEHLRDLAADPESLTDSAHLALRHVLVARGLAQPPVPDALASRPPGPEHEQGFTPGIPGVFPSSAASVEQALEPSGDVSNGMAFLYNFFDGHELSRACAALEEAGIDLALEPQDRDALAGAPTSFIVRVAVDDLADSQALLRDKMGLFPLQEVEADDSHQTAGSAEPTLLGSFETAPEVEQVTALLQAAGIHPTIEPEDPDDPKSWHSVLVPAADYDRGMEVLTEGLALS